MVVRDRIRNRRRPNSVTVAAFGLLALWGLVASPAWSVEGHDEDKVMAAYLINFAKYIEWPDSSFKSASAPFVICVLGDDDFANTSEKLIGGRKTNERTVVVRKASEPDAAQGCHILFVPDSEQSRQRQVIAALKRQSVFVIAESKGFAEQGGVANFVREGDKLRFEINRTAAESAGLKVSSRLLRIAIVVG